MTYVTEAAAGAAWFDEFDPDWWREVDTKVLDINSVTFCVIGQYLGRPENFTRYDEFIQDNHLLFRQVALGFKAGDAHDYWLLTKGWKSEIQRRQP